MTRGGLLVLAAHPDDEVLLAGGTLAACSQRGIPTAVVCLTEGEEGPIADPSLATRDTLATRRRHELRDACAQLGVAWVKCYRRKDGYLLWSDRSAIVGQLVRVLEERRPDALITFGDDGLYYHPDHIAAYEFATRAVARLDDPPAMYRAVWGEESINELVEELRSRGLPADVWGLHPSDFGRGPDGQTFTLDVRHLLDRKLRALRAHRTQFGSGHAFTVIPHDLAERYLGFERFAPMNDAAAWLQTTLDCVNA